ncbi:hypothetical protein KAR91_02900 [Candidatus Pacearchaeota archaeon]|nr:hypothetical protein [Candidatus Pacearchaeota archaeon]
MKKILVVLTVICTANIAFAKTPVFKDKKLKAMSELIVEMGGNGYAGVQSDSTSIGCVAGVKNPALARSTAQNRARAPLAFKLAKIAMKKYLRKEPNGKKPLVSFQEAVSRNIEPVDNQCRPLGKTQVCCSKLKKRK